MKLLTSLLVSRMKFCSPLAARSQTISPSGQVRLYFIFCFYLFWVELQNVLLLNFLPRNVQRRERTPHKMFKPRKPYPQGILPLKLKSPSKIKTFPGWTRLMIFLSNLATNRFFQLYSQKGSVAYPKLLISDLDPTCQVIVIPIPSF